MSCSCPLKIRPLPDMAPTGLPTFPKGSVPTLYNFGTILWGSRVADDFFNDAVLRRKSQAH